MTIDEFLARMRSGEQVAAGSDVHLFMIDLAHQAQQLTVQLNTSYHTPDEIRRIMGELTGAAIPESFAMFPPFTTDCGKHTTIGENVFINSGCRFQDQGGLTIGDNCLIGHNVVIATLNHDLDPAHRADVIPAPVVLERNVWIGANATILAGVTIGENAVVAAGAVVTKHVAANTVVGGVPAKPLRLIQGS